MKKYNLDIREVELLRQYLQEQKSISFINRKFTKPTLQKILICLWLPSGGSKKEMIIKLQDWDATHRFAGLIKEENKVLHHQAKRAISGEIARYHMKN